MAEEIKGLVNKTDGTGYGDARDVFVQIDEPRIAADLEANGFHLTNVANPRTGQPKDVTNKEYVDGVFNTINDNLITQISNEASSRTESDDILTSTTVDIYNKLDRKADLDINDQVVLDQIPPEAREIRYAADLTERDSIAEKFIGLIALVDDASDDPNVTTGSALYFCTDDVAPSWRLISSLNTVHNLQDQIDSLQFNDLVDVQGYSSSTDIQLVKVNEEGNGLDYITTFDLSTYTVTPTKIVNQQFLSTVGQTEFQMNYRPSSEDSLEMFLNENRQMYGIAKDYIIDMDTGIVTFNERNGALQAGDEILFRYLRGTEATHSELNGIMKTNQEGLIGVVDGGNKVFSISEIPVDSSSLVVFKSSVYQEQDVDYIIEGNIVTFDVAPQIGSKLNCIYRVFDITTLTIQETISGTSDGINLYFSLSEFPIDHNCVVIYKNGVYQIQGVGKDYTITGKNIVFTNPPATGSKIHAVYEKNTSELVIGPVSGNQIINAGDIDIAIEELLNEREYESNSDYHIQLESINPLNALVIPIQFSTKKRIVPIITLTETSSTNIDLISVTSVSDKGFSLVINPTNSGLVQWNGLWESQC